MLHLKYVLIILYSLNIIILNNYCKHKYINVSETYTIVTGTCNIVLNDLRGMSKSDCNYSNSHALKLNAPIIT